MEALLRNDTDRTVAGSANPGCIPLTANDSPSCSSTRCAETGAEGKGAKWLWSPKTACQLYLNFPLLKGVHDTCLCLSWELEIMSSRWAGNSSIN